MRSLKMFTIGLVVAAIFGFTATETVNLKKHSAMNTIQNDPGGSGGWKTSSTVATGDPGGGGGWEPSIKTVDTTPDV